MGREDWVFAAKLVAFVLAAVGLWLRSWGGRPAARLGFQGDEGGSMKTRYKPGDKRVQRLSLVDAGGGATDYTEKPIVWASEAPDVVQVIPAPDGTSAVLAFLKPGTAAVGVAAGPLAAKMTFVVTGPAVKLDFADEDDVALTPTPTPTPGPTPALAQSGPP